MDIKDAPERLLPSAEVWYWYMFIEFQSTNPSTASWQETWTLARKDRLCSSCTDPRQELREISLIYIYYYYFNLFLSLFIRNSLTLNTYSKIQQVMKDTSRVIGDERNFLKDKTEDGAAGDSVQRVANIAQDFVDLSWETLDKLWSNWAALVTVIAAGSAGSWKQMLEQSGRLISDLRHTEDFVKLLKDMRTAFYSLSQHLQKVLHYLSTLKGEFDLTICLETTCRPEIGRSEQRMGSPERQTFGWLEERVQGACWESHLEPIGSKKCCSQVSDRKDCRHHQGTSSRVCQQDGRQQEHHQAQGGSQGSFATWYFIYLFYYFVIFFFLKPVFIC